MWINGNIEEEPEVGKVEKGLGTFIDSGTESQVYRSVSRPKIALPPSVKRVLWKLLSLTWG